MVVLDTDSLSVLQSVESNLKARLGVRLREVDRAEITTTVVTYEEQTRGWMAYKARAKTISQEIQAYAKLSTHIEKYRTIIVLDFDEEAAAELQRLRRLKIRIGTMDLKIAAIVLVRNATLLTRNLVDFRKVPGLKAEDWTTE
jgi:tRNA(fMet)-specific endonuclease VapC